MSRRQREGGRREFEEEGRVEKALMKKEVRTEDRCMESVKKDESARRAEKRYEE